jgi:3-dehydroquinate dehydratase-2
VITQVLVLNGPNLGRLGLREPEVYGSALFDDLAELCRSTGRKLGLSVEVRQTDDERELISWVHEAADGRLPAREEFRHTPVVAGVANGTVAGFGLVSYQLALQAIAELAGPSWHPSRVTSPRDRPRRLHGGG